METQHALERWLVAATEGLPTQVAALTAAELLAHFEDAAADYESAGATPDEARRLALADLGAVEKTSDGLRDVHIGTRRYGLSAGLSLLFLAVLLGYPILINASGLGSGANMPIIYLVYTLLLFIPASIAMNNLRNLAEWRLGIKGLRLPLLAVVISLFTYMALDVFTISRFGYGVGINTGVSPFAADTLFEAIIAAGIAIAHLIISGGLGYFAYRLWPQRQFLYGLGLPICILLGLLAVGIGMPAVGIVLQNPALEMMFLMLAQLSHLAFWPILTLFFFRAVYRPPALPRRIA